MKNYFIILAVFTFSLSALADQKIPPIKTQPARPLILHPSTSKAVLRVLDNEDDASLPNLLQNPKWSSAKDKKPVGWIAWKSAFTLSPNVDSDHPAAVAMQRGANSLYCL